MSLCFASLLVTLISQNSIANADKESSFCNAAAIHVKKTPTQGMFSTLCKVVYVC